MEINKVKKYNRQGKIFSILLKIFCIVLGLILALILFGAAILIFSPSFALGLILITMIASVYIMPVLGVIAVILALMYIVKTIQYTDKKGLMIFRIVISVILLVSMMIGAFFSFWKYGLSNTYVITVNSKIEDVQDSEIRANLYDILEDGEIYVKKIVLIGSLGFRETIHYYDVDEISKTYSSTIDDMDYGAIRDKGTEITWLTQYLYVIFIILAIISLVFLYDNLSKQYKLMLQKAIDEVEKNEAEGTSITEEQIIRSGKRKIIITLSIIATLIVLTVIIASFINYLERKKEEERFLAYQESLNYTVNDTSEEMYGEEFEHFFDDQNGIWIQMKNPFRDRYAVQIYKTEDGGENWEEIASNLSEVYIGSEFMFLNENVGFLHDPHGGVDSYATLKITTDGGYTWEDVIVNKPEEITEKNIFFRGLPTVNGDKLEVIAYTVRYPDEKYFLFESTDLGKTWNYVREVSYSEILNTVD